ncbi:hypothetical protein AB1N83_003021 [Pleurotus pulmonarius]
MAPKEQPAGKALKDFISVDPASKYTFDSERDAPTSEICREKDRECVKLQMHSKKMFESMQDLGFFCVLPMDPARTYIECTPLPK